MSNEGIAGTVGRPLSALVVLTAGTVMLPAPWSPGTWSSPHAGSAVLGAAVLAAAAVLVWSLLLWTAAVTLLMVAARGTGRLSRVAQTTLRHLLPAAARRTITATLGLSLLSGCAVHATEHAPDTSHPTTAAAAGTSSHGATRSEIDGSGSGTVRGVPFPPGSSKSAAASHVLLVLTPKTSTIPHAAPTTMATPITAPANINVDWPGPDTPASTSVHAEPEVVVVHRGDSLWAIAARHLGGHPSDAQIDHAWRAWYAANRAVVGADPDLILPGQQLRPPTSEPNGGS